jgi:hypothetical protein
MNLRALAGLIALAGVIATAFLLFRNSRPASDSEMNTLRRLGTDATAQMQQRLELELIDRTTSGEQQRLDSPLGQALSRRCVEWTTLAENHPSPETTENQARACGALRNWVREGIAPERPPGR